MKLKNHFYLERWQVYSLGCLVLFLIVIFLLFRMETSPKEEIEYEFVSQKKIQDAQPLTEFDPNELDEKQWMNLGFTEKQVAIIMKYKSAVGGQFSSKQQLKKCYSISESKFAELEPYLLLPDLEQRENSSKQHQNFSKEKKKLQIHAPIHPDALTQSDWEKIGFSKSQAQSLLKYKAYLGGSFQSKEKFKAAFVVSDEYYRQLSNYLLLPEKSVDKPRYGNTISKSLKPFDPNDLDIEGWKNIGFTEKQAISILNYKNRYLKGRFRTMEDIEKNHIIKDKFETLKPYIQLKEEIQTIDNKNSINQSAPKNITSNEERKINLATVELNTVSIAELKSLGFSDKNAFRIVDFRKVLGGFVSKNQLFEVYGIDREKAEMMVQNCSLSTENVPKYSLTDAPESWLKTHPYFKYYADKIIYYRISYPEEKKIWKLIKVPPEKEAKMRLYLR